MKKFAALALACAAFAATPAAALDVVEPCDLTLPDPDAIDCAGYYSGNLINGSDEDVANQTTALGEIGFTWDGDWSSVEDTVVLSLQNGNQINFGQTLYGVTYIGMHFGNVAGPAGNVSVFWKFDFGSEGADYIALDNVQGFSNAVLYSTAVPEPATWMMLLLGFAAVGASLRHGKAKRRGLKDLATA